MSVTSRSSASAGSVFRSFWKSNDRQTGTNGTTFVHHNANVGQDGRNDNRASTPARDSSSSTSGESVIAQARATVQKRRQQIYQAQKRHRNRKADYLQTLEAEVRRLQHLDAEVTSQKNELARQNQVMREMLTSQSLGQTLGGFELREGSAVTSDESQLGGTSIAIRFDPTVQAERVFVDFDEPADAAAPRQSQREHADLDSWTAMDFILALEWPCRHHVKHAGISPEAQIPLACEVAGVHGHALTATSAVFACAQREPCHHDICSPTDIDSSLRQKWQLPYAEIEKLIALSEKLELDDEQLTPAQAYAAVREAIPSGSGHLLRPVLEQLKEPLGKLVQCLGFGTVLPADKFWQRFESVMQTVGSEAV